MDCGMGTADCGLGIKYGLGIKRGLRTGYKIRTTDYFGENGAQLVIFAWFCSCVLGWFCQLFIFSARHQLDTWTLAPQRTRGMA